MKNAIVFVAVLLAVGVSGAQEKPTPATEDPRELVEQASQLWDGLDARKTQVAEAEELLKKAVALDGRLIEAHFDQLCQTVSREHGKTNAEARGSIFRGLENIEYACGIPTLLFIKGGEVKERVTGFMPKEKLSAKFSPHFN